MKGFYRKLGRIIGMKTPNIDKRSERDVIESIKKIASSYTPEWKFDEQNPDVGTALGLIYANMMSDSIKKFNRVLEKNKLSFFQQIGTKLLPAIPASGYITMNVTEGVLEGEEVKKGTKLVADAVLEDSNNLIFETNHDMYVTPAKLTDIYITDGRKDNIISIYQREEGSNVKKPFYLFDEKGENLQEHSVYFGHKSMLSMEGETCVTIGFQFFHLEKLPKKILENFLNPNIVEIAYTTKEGYCSFARRTLFEGNLLLWKAKDQPRAEPVIQGGQDAIWIRLKIKDITPFQNFFVDTIFLKTDARKIMPELVYANGIEQRTKELLPFGDHFFEWNECYIASREVFSKKGASIELAFDLNFIKVKLEDIKEKNEIDWKLIMKKKDFKPDVEYDITIHSVVWEYYNGFGWKSLFENSEYEDIFCAKSENMNQRMRMKFECPKDIEPFLMNSLFSYYIRVRILRVNNTFKLNGYYIAPIISYLQLQYEYKKNGEIPDYMILNHNREQIVYKKNQIINAKKGISLIQRLEEEKKTLYFGFEKAPIGAPIKILFVMKESIRTQLGRMQFEYYGSNKWNTLNVIDETDNFRQTGILTIIGNYDFIKRNLYGKNLYWIRMIDIEDYYNPFDAVMKLPCVTAIHMNTTPIIAVETQPEELFKVEANQKYITCQLLKKQVYQIQVWVDENKELDRRMYLQVEKEYPVEYTYNQEGEVISVWVQWKEVEDFSLSNSSDRHYIVDKIEGTVLFSDGKNGKIPISGQKETIRIQYSCGGGRIGNLEANTITRLNQSIGFINDIKNKESTTGGCDQETIEEAIKRKSAALKHGYRAVTTRDFELMAQEATRNIWKTKCFANCNQYGKKQYGNITLVILQKDFQKGRIYFDKIREQIYQYLQPRMAENIAMLNHFYIIEPTFLEINISVSMVVKEFHQVFEIRKNVLQRLEEFLDPIKGNFNQKGWEIGMLPNKTQVLNVLKDIKSIYYIKTLKMTAYRQGNHGMVEVDLESKESNRFALALSGTHEIFIEME